MAELEAIGTLIQKYNFIDTTKYFIIAVDALGNGISTSISNSDNPDSVFYNLTIDDMVNANYLLLLNHFNIKRYLLQLRINGQHASFPDGSNVSGFSK